METLLPELYGLIYSELSTKSWFNLALSCPAAMRAFLRFTRGWHRDTFMDILHHNFKAVASISKIELLLACGRFPLVLQEVLLCSLNARTGQDIDFNELWKRHDTEITMSRLGPILTYIYDATPIINSAKRLNWDMQMMFSHALTRMNTRMCKLMIQTCGVNPSTDNNLAIYAACVRGDDELLLLLLADPRTNINARGELIYQAIKCHHEHIVKILLNYITPTECDMELAVKMREYDIFHMLLDDGRVDPAHANNLILYKLTKRGDMEEIKRLLGTNRVNPLMGLDVYKVARKRGYNDLIELFDTYLHVLWADNHDVKLTT